MKNPIRFQTCKIKTAKTFFQKLLGFMFKKNADYGLFFENTKYIHTFFMRFNLDIFFLDKDRKIILVKKNTPPFKIVLPPKKTASVLEMPSKKQKAAAIGRFK